MHHRGVIAATEVTTNLFEAESGVPSSQPHTDLTRNSDRLVTSLAQEVGQFHIVIAGHRVDNGLDRGGCPIRATTP